MFTESAAFYDALYHAKDYAGEAARVAALVRQRHPAARTLLDLACGTGEHARHLAALGFAVDGVDREPGMIAAAQAKRLPGRFEVGDMTTLDLGRSYDAVVCLFSSIAYAVTPEGVARVLAAAARHLAPGGVLLVEPWFPPGVLDPARTFHDAAELPGARCERTSRVEIVERVSRLHFHYRIEEAGRVREVDEVHELGLFTPGEMAARFAGAGLAAAFDPHGLTGRGLWVAWAAAPYAFEEALPLLRATPGVLRAWLAELPAAWLHADEGPGSWSPYDIVGHLLHGERTDWVPRVEHLLRHGEAVAFPPFDREAMRATDAPPPLADLLDAFAAARAESLERLAALNLGAADLARRGRHPEFGPVTLGQHLATWVAHDQSHLAQIARVMARRYGPAIGPWRAYLPLTIPRL